LQWQTTVSYSLTNDIYPLPHHTLFIDLRHNILHQQRITQLQRETSLPFEHPFSYMWNIIPIAATNFHDLLHASMEG
jgi:hypothetical protein